MYGFNVTQQTFNYDNRPVAPLTNYTFDQWWFHGHLDHPPNPGDIFDLPAGGTATTEIACNKGATTYFASSEGGDIRNPDKPNDPCPGSQSSEYHTTGFDDLKGCALAIAYKNDARAVNPEVRATFFRLSYGLTTPPGFYRVLDQPNLCMESFHGLSGACSHAPMSRGRLHLRVVLDPQSRLGRRAECVLFTRLLSDLTSF